MDSPVRQYQKQKDYRRHKLFRKINRRRKAERQQAIDAPMKELKKRLRRFGDGKDKYYYQTTDKETGTVYNVHPSAFDAKELEVTLPETTIKAPRKYEYRSLFDGNQEHIGDMVSLVPIAGDMYDAYNAVQDAINGNYTSAAILGLGAIIPGQIDKLGKALLKKGLKYSPETVRSLYDIKNLYTGVKDNPRLRKYANETADLLSSAKIQNRRPTSDFSPALQSFVEKSNIYETPIGINHSNKMWDLLNINLEPVGINKVIQTKIPIPFKARGVYNPNVNFMKVKRHGLSPDEIRHTAYHEASHASDLGLGNQSWEELVPKNNSEYFGRSTEKRARGIQTLTDMQHLGLDIDDIDVIRDYIINHRNHGADDLLLKYNYKNRSYASKIKDLASILKSGYNSGKDSGIHIKPQNRGKFTALKKRTGKSASWFKAHGTPAQKKMATFALNSRHWSKKR